MELRLGHREATGRAGADKRGLVLVACVGVLGVLSLMGLTFVTVMRLESKAARNFTDAVRAEFVARAGIEDAIARLRAMARQGLEVPFEDVDEDGTFEPAAWYTSRGRAGGGPKISFPAHAESNFIDDDHDGAADQDDPEGNEDWELGYTDYVGSTYADAGDNYTLRVQDAASKINVNAGDNLGVMLDNLCRTLGSPLVAAYQKALVPMHFIEDLYKSEDPGARKKVRYYGDRWTAQDKAEVIDLFYRVGADGRPIVLGQGQQAVYGDGYAIAAHRARNGPFFTIEDVRSALTYIERNDNGRPDLREEQMEIEVKFAALRPYITIDSWWDTDQVCVGKFEHVGPLAGGRYYATDRNKTWNVRRNFNAGTNNPDPRTESWEGELKGCLVAIINGVGQGQLKTIAYNTIDTIFFEDTAVYYPGSTFQVQPLRGSSSYMIIGLDARTDADRDTLKQYARQPLSFHRAPINVNTAPYPVLVAAIMGIQTAWGGAGYTNGPAVGSAWDNMAGAIGSQCPSVISVARDGFSAFVPFDRRCPNNSNFDNAYSQADDIQVDFGHTVGGACFFCNYGRRPDKRSGNVGEDLATEAHLIAWQILCERETSPLQGWDDLYFRCFRPFDEDDKASLHVDYVGPSAYTESRNLRFGSVSTKTGVAGHRGLAKLLMANFNSNTGILKFNPNIEWIDRYGPNFTDLYIPYPELLKGSTAAAAQTIRVVYTAGTFRMGDVKLRIRPGELLDKTDLNVSTTEFCFDSGGVYDVESVGRVYDRSGNVVAERKLAALMKIYDVWRESTQREFVRGTIMLAEDGSPVKNTDPAISQIQDSRRAGQITVDTVSDGNPKGAFARASVRKALATYPEPLVPGDYRSLTTGQYPPLALNSGGLDSAEAQPAGYDGYIMLATNRRRTHDDDTMTFLEEFTGGVHPDHAAGPAKPETERVGGEEPLDMLSLLGKRDDMGFDLPYRRTPDLETWEGEGRTGDLRVDGCYFGLVGFEHLDGSIRFSANDNLNAAEGCVSMWVKPTWHHGTRMKPSLPNDYILFAKNSYDDSASYEYGGSTNAMYGFSWMYDGRDPPDGDRTNPEQFAVYVRDRFEHELFNAGGQEACIGRRKNWRLLKAGDFTNSRTDNWANANECEISSLWFETENGLRWPNGHFSCHIPGYGGPDNNRPYYQMCPFRWFFVGARWNYHVKGRSSFFSGGSAYSRGDYDPTVGRTEGLDRPTGWGGGGRTPFRWYGLPLEGTLRFGFFEPPDAGKQASPTQDRTGTTGHHYSLVLLGHPFVDTMRSWSWDTKYGSDEWAFKNWGTMYLWRTYPFDADGGFVPELADFGINKVRNMELDLSSGREGVKYRFYSQSSYSGTYATIDAWAIHNAWVDPRKNVNWPREMRRATGRYYMAISGLGSELPWFESQTLYESERVQSFTFAPGEKEVKVELGCVRWTVFTPRYCLEIDNPGSFRNTVVGRPNYGFPIDDYFASADERTRPAPDRWRDEGSVAGNIRYRHIQELSPRRGVKVLLKLGNTYVGRDGNTGKGLRKAFHGGYDSANKKWKYVWPIYTAGSNVRHARVAPEDLRYRVIFHLPEVDALVAGANKDAMLLDSPVFDDITITYLRRPKIIQWREVAE